MDLSAFYQVRLFGKLHLIVNKVELENSSLVSEYSDLVKMCMWCWVCLYICCLYLAIWIPNCLIWWLYHISTKIMSCFALSMSCFCPLIERNKQMNMAMGVYGVFFKKKMRWMNLIFISQIELHLRKQKCKSDVICCAWKCIENWLMRNKLDSYQIYSDITWVGSVLSFLIRCFMFYKA